MRRIIITSVCAILSSPSLYANHSWSTYHWARTTSSFDLIVVNSTTNDWDGYVNIAIGDWSNSSKLTLNQDVNGDTSNKTRRQCRAPEGQVRICNLDYGYNGWLGIAGIYLDANGHIVKGYTKLNDSYFSSSYYDTPEWKQSVTCQELGHDLGLGHQDENFNNQSLSSCMDYQNPPYPYPNSHDFEQLDLMYGHLDSYDSYDTGASSSVDGGDGGGDGCNAPAGRGCNKGQEPNSGAAGDVGWGMSVGRRGQTETFVRTLPDGSQIVTFVTWAVGY